MALSSVWTTRARTFRSLSKQHQHKRLFLVITVRMKWSNFIYDHHPGTRKKFIKISGYGYHLENVRSTGGCFYKCDFHVEDSRRRLMETPTSNQKYTINCLVNPRETRCGKKKPCWAGLDTGWWPAGKTSSSFSLSFFFFVVLLSYSIIKWALQSTF